MTTTSELRPIVGETWRHHNGNLYDVTGFANVDCDCRHRYPETVIYKNIINGNVFARFLHDWHRSFEIEA